MLVDVLLGEANDGHAELAEAALREHGVVRSFYRSRDGLETLARVCQRSKEANNPIGVPLLIVLDVKLPGLSGMEVLRELKCDKCLCRNPVVIMAAAHDFKQAAKCRGLGGDLYVSKWTVFLGLSGFASRIRGLVNRSLAENAVQNPRSVL